MMSERRSLLRQLEKSDVTESTSLCGSGADGKEGLSRRPSRYHLPNVALVASAEVRERCGGGLAYCLRLWAVM